jgi:hypothetical protein
MVVITTSAAGAVDEQAEPLVISPTEVIEGRAVGDTTQARPTAG